MGRARALSTLAWLVCLAWPCARAEAADLLWSAPVACDDRALLEQNVERLYGQPLAAIEARTIEALITSEASGQFKLQLRTWLTGREPAPTLRELVASDCKELIEAAAVAIVVAANSRREVETVAPFPAASREPAEVPPRPGTPQPVPEGEHLGFALGVGALLDFGSLPSAAWGVEVHVAGSYAWLRLMLFAGFLPARERTLGFGRFGEFSLAFARAMACGEQTIVTTTRVYACGGLELGSLHAEIDGVPAPSLTLRPVSRAWRALGGLFGVTTPLVLPLALTAMFGISVPLTRDQFLILPREVIHRSAAVGVRVLLGLTIVW